MKMEHLYLFQQMPPGCETCFGENAKFQIQKFAMEINIPDQIYTAICVVGSFLKHYSTNEFRTDSLLI